MLKQPLSRSFLQVYLVLPFALIFSILHFDFVEGPYTLNVKWESLRCIPDMNLLPVKNNFIDNFIVLDI